MNQDKQVIAELLNHYLALATIVGLVVIFILILYITYTFNTKKESNIISLLARYALPLGFFTSLFGMVMSLFYSEYLAILPCDLCWFQRIFIYSQVFLFGVAWYKKDNGIFLYSLWLSLVGMIIGLYHHMMQLGYDVYKPCSTAPFALDCSKPTFIEYGFVTFPLMAVVLFGILILLATIVMKKGK